MKEQGSQLLPNPAAHESQGEDYWGDDAAKNLFSFTHWEAAKKKLMDWEYCEARKNICLHRRLLQKLFGTHTRQPVR